MRPFVGRTREVAHLQDGKLAQARIEPALVADELPETCEGSQAIRTVRERAVQRDIPCQQILVLGGKIIFVEVGYTGHDRLSQFSGPDYRAQELGASPRHPRPVFGR